MVRYGGHVRQLTGKGVHDLFTGSSFPFDSVERETHASFLAATVSSESPTIPSTIVVPSSSHASPSSRFRALTRALTTSELSIPLLPKFNKLSKASASSVGFDRADLFRSNSESLADGSRDRERE